MISSTQPARSDKLFVVDTNVILHDAECIRRFKEHDIAIPIAVLEELDHFKKGNEAIHFQARAFLRTVDELTGDVLSPNGAALGLGLGSIRIVLGEEPDARLEKALLEDNPDHRILSVALMLQQRKTQRPVVLVSKDTNLRLKARCPTEIQGLKWQDVQLDANRFNIDSKKTGLRFCPIFQEVLPILREAFDAAKDGMSTLFRSEGRPPISERKC